MSDTVTAPAGLKLSLTRDASGGFFARAGKMILQFLRSTRRLVGTLFTIGFSLLPLAALLVALPAVSPKEAVLTDTVRPTKSWIRRTGRRVLAFFAGIAVLVALLAFAIEVVSHLPLPASGQLGTLARKVFGFSVADFVPDDPKPADLPTGKTWLTTPELLERRDSLRQATARQNLLPLDKREAEEKLAEVEAEIAERTPNSAKLRVTLDPQLKPICAVPLWQLMPTTLVSQWPFVLLLCTRPTWDCCCSSGRCRWLTTSVISGQKSAKRC